LTPPSFVSSNPALVYGGLAFAAVLLIFALYLLLSDSDSGTGDRKGRKTPTHGLPDGPKPPTNVNVVTPVPVPPPVPALLPGLAGAYYRGAQFAPGDLLLKRVDPALTFDWGAKSPDDRVPTDSFCVRWKGVLRADRSGTYEFRAYSDDGSRMWIDGKLIYDYWGPNWGEVRGTAQLIAGDHSLFIEYAENMGMAAYKLSWVLPGATQAVPVPADAFWHEADEDAAVRPTNLLMGSTTVPELEPPERWRNAIDLLALVDPEKDAVHGKWSRLNAGLTVEQAGEVTLELPYEPPAEYTFRIVFVRLTGTENVKQILTRQGTGFAWTMSNGGRHGFEMVAGSNYNPQSSAPMNQLLENGREYTSVVQVRRDGVWAWMDGKQIAYWLPRFGTLSPMAAWQLRSDDRIGVGGYLCRIAFKRIDVLEISGKGKVLRTAP
jgi:hypothetical protein